MTGYPHYLIAKNGLFVDSLAAVAIVTVAVHLMAHPVRGVGIAVPLSIPPAVATVTALLLDRDRAPALAFIGGTLGNGSVNLYQFSVVWVFSSLSPSPSSSK